MHFDHFDAIAGFYDWAPAFILSERLAGCLSLTPNNLLLDAGGGTGRVALVLRSLVRGAIVVDTSSGMLHRAAAKGLTAIYSPVESLPFPSGSIDRVVMIDALHHVSDQRQTIRELWRVLAPGGRLVIVEPELRRLSSKVMAVIEKLLLMRSHILSDEKIKALFLEQDVQIDLVNEGLQVIVLAIK